MTLNFFFMCKYEQVKLLKSPLACKTRKTERHFFAHFCFFLKDHNCIVSEPYCVALQMSFRRWMFI